MSKKNRRKRESEIEYYILDDKKILEDFRSLKKGSMNLFGTGSTLSNYRRKGVSKESGNFSKLEKYIMVNENGQLVWRNKKSADDNISFFDKNKELTELEKKSVKKICEIQIENLNFEELINYLYKDGHISEDFKDSINVDNPILLRSKKEENITNETLKNDII